MKAAILAGGKGMRLARSPDDRPKALADVGGKPLLWHVIEGFARFGLDDVTVALGHRGDEIRAWFDDAGAARPKFLETGAETQTGGRVKRLAEHFMGERFLLSWCDGISDIDLAAMIAFHRAHGKVATLAAVRPPPRYGHLTLDGDRVGEFREKPPREEGWINGGFFVLEPAIADWIDGDDASFEEGALADLAAAGQLMAFRHEGFWTSVDTPRDLSNLQRLWESGEWPLAKVHGTRCGA